MGKRKERLSDEKKNIIADLIREYDIQSAGDIQDALKDLLGGTIIESMLAAEMDNHLGYDPYNRTMAQMLAMERSRR
jgi:putative transposase